MVCERCWGSGEDPEDIGDPCFNCDGFGYVCDRCGDGIGIERDDLCHSCLGREAVTATQESEPEDGRDGH